MSQYKLTFFNLRERGEPLRLILHMAGKDFLDDRMDAYEWGSRQKQEQPFEQLPVFEGDGMKISQSKAIGRYLANKLGYAGKNLQDLAKIDMMVDACYDVVDDFLQTVHNSSNEKHVLKAQKRFYKHTLPNFLANCERVLQQNRNGNLYFITDRMTWADLVIFHWVTWFPLYGRASPVENYPALSHFISRMEKNPKIIEWRKYMYKPYPTNGQ